MTTVSAPQLGSPAASAGVGGGAAREGNAGGAGGALASIEWVRVVACIGIVAFHVSEADTPGRQVALGGLPAFTALTVALAARSAQGRPFREFARGRWRTLGAPWLFWSAFYGALLTLRGLRHSGQEGWTPLWWATPTMPLMGPEIHLWFLPFALVATLVVGAWAKRWAGAVGWMPWLGVMAAATLLVCRAHEGGGFPPPLGQWVSVLPAAAIGACLGQLRPGDVSRWRALGAIGIVTVAVLVIGVGAGYGAALIPSAVGLPLTIMAWGLPVKAGPRLLAWSRLSYGVYLLHPFFKVSLAHWTGEDRTVLTLAVVAASFVGAAVLRRTKLKAVV